ncbi:MAG: hypothetical protein K8U57_19620 [Planctomycetes bacterium]|nr:hypothetical protein [Planctomycetota bacterium]
MFENAEVIHSYTRANALADGVLIDVSETAREAGIRFPVALTQAVWEGFVRVPEGVEAQDERGRLWDVVWMLRNAIARTQGDTCNFTVYVRNDNRRPKPFQFKALCHGGDNAEPISTVMLPDED